ncbi:MAG TPA: imidazole glycerol phosphate synthase subunit HisH [Desertimonas sp.]|nr:imidazole glycerol phosphate synthase subunit HisH [Desertimonas sp.]
MIARPVIAVVDYGIGNLHSAHKALVRLEADARLTDDVGLIGDAAGVVLPGVGSFGACMAALRGRRLDEPVLHAAESGRPFLGICVGMQMLFADSEESPGVDGLGVIPGTVCWIPGDVKRPQMQWNIVSVVDDADPLFTGLESKPWFYFVHSLHGVPDDESVVTATCEYGTTLNAGFRRGSVAAVQFHPEKSASWGLSLLGNFVRDVAGDRVGVASLP